MEIAKNVVNTFEGWSEALEKMLKVQSYKKFFAVTSKFALVVVVVVVLVVAPPVTPALPVVMDTLPMPLKFDLRSERFLLVIAILSAAFAPRQQFLLPSPCLELWRLTQQIYQCLKPVWRTRPRSSERL